MGRLRNLEYAGNGIVASAKQAAAADRKLICRNLDLGQPDGLARGLRPSNFPAQSGEKFAHGFEGDCRCRGGGGGFFGPRRAGASIYLPAGRRAPPRGFFPPRPPLEKIQRQKPPGGEPRGSPQSARRER